MKRPAWLSRRIETQKALRELPLCELCGIKSGRGWHRDGLWLCVQCAVDAQRAQREAK